MGPGRLQCLGWQSWIRLRPGVDPWVRTIPWRRQWHPTPALLPGKSHVRRSLVGYSPWCRKESETTEQLHFRFSNSTTTVPKLDKRALTAPSLSTWRGLTPASSFILEFLQLGKRLTKMGCGVSLEFLRITEIQQDPMGLPGTKAFLCPLP